MNRGEAHKQLLWDFFIVVNEFLQELEVDYWVNYGTLLGFYREGEILGHDIDIDFGCHEKHYSNIWENRHKLGGDIPMYDTSNRHLGPKLYMSLKGFDADIYFYRQENGKLHSYEQTKWENYNTPIPSELVFPTEEMDVKGVKTRIPGQTEEYLEFIYGNLSPDAERNLVSGYWE